MTKTDGVVLTLNLRSATIRSIKLGNGAQGEIENSFATDEHDGVYIATNRKLYRFAAGKRGRPLISWQVTYPNSGEHKIGQVDDGTGTTPLVMPGGYVSITDNADPMDVVVYRTATERAPTVVPKVSLANGLIYTYTKDPGMSDPWYWTTIDFRTGRTVYKQFAGSNPLGFYNNNYAGIALSPSGTAYLGTLGGLIAMRDS